MRITSPLRSLVGADRLRDADALLWNIERDPVLRSTIVAVAVLDRPPDVRRLGARLERAAAAFPALRRVVVRDRLGRPRWVDDRAFDLAYHLRRIACPAPGTVRDALDLVEPLAAAAFDPTRPLWEFTVVEGLADGRALLVQKLHHSLTDGVGAIAIAAMLLDLERDVIDPVDAGVPDHTPSRSPSLRGMVVGAARAGLRALTDPAGTAHDAAVAVRLLAPALAPCSPLMRGRGTGRRLAVLDVPLDGLRAASRAAGGTLNDAFLAAVTGALRRYHDAYGAPVEELRVTMPVNVRVDDDAIGGNRFSPVRFTVPVDGETAAQRVQDAAACSHEWRDERALSLTDVLAAALNRLPTRVTTRVFGGMLKNVDFVATNVPGVPVPVYLAGAKVEREYAFGPPSGSAVSFALVSHVDTCCIGVNVDTTAVRDPQRLVSCLRESFDEVLALGAVREPDADADAGVRNVAVRNVEVAVA